MDWYNTKLNQLKNVCTSMEESEGEALMAYLKKLGLAEYYDNDGLTLDGTVRVVINTGKTGNVKNAAERIQTDHPHTLSNVRTARELAKLIAIVPEFMEYAESVNGLNFDYTGDVKVVVDGDKAIGSYQTVDLPIAISRGTVSLADAIWAMAIVLALFFWGLQEAIEIANTDSLNVPTLDTSYELD